MTNTPEKETDTTKTHQVPAPAMSRRYYLFLILYMVLLSAFGSFVNDMYIPCLPQMIKVFGCSVPQIQLSLTMGMIGLGLGEIIFGPLSDKYGRKPILIFSLVMFAVAAGVSILSKALGFFLFCRLVQGLGGSAGYFLARTIPADIFGGRRLARFMGIIGAINGLAPALAPLIGGVLADSTGWKGIFIVLCAFSLLLLALSGKLRETLLPPKRLKGSVFRSFGSYRRLLTNRRFMTHVMLKDVALGLLFAYIASSPFIMETHYGWSATMYGLFTGINAIGMGLGSLAASRFKVLKRAGYIGAWVMFGSVCCLAATLFLTNSFWLYELLLIPMLFAMGMQFTVGNTLAMNEGRGDAGSASGLLGVFGYVIGAGVSPLVGMGNIMHSTAIVFLVIAAAELAVAYASRRLPADLTTGNNQ